MRENIHKIKIGFLDVFMAQKWTCAHFNLEKKIHENRFTTKTNTQKTKNHKIYILFIAPS